MDLLLLSLLRLSPLYYVRCKHSAGGVEASKRQVKADACLSPLPFSLFSPLLPPTFWPKRQYGKNAAKGDVFVLALNFTFLARPRGGVFTFLARAKNVKKVRGAQEARRTCPFEPQMRVITAHLTMISSTHCHCIIVCFLYISSCGSVRLCPRGGRGGEGSRAGRQTPARCS